MVSFELTLNDFNQLYHQLENFQSIRLYGQLMGVWSGLNFFFLP